MKVPVKRKRLHRKPPPENAVHCQLADVLRLSARVGWLWWHTPNGGGRPAFITKNGKRISPEGGRLKKMGVKPGVSDFLLLSPTGDLHALELKAEGKRPDDDQVDFMRAVVDAGGKADWADSFDDAVAILTDWDAIKGATL